MPRVVLALVLGIVAFGLVVMIVFGVHAYSRFRRMNNFGRRAGERLSGLADQAGALSERVDDLTERSEATAVAVQER